VTPQQLSAGGDAETLKRAFLDRLAEVLSPNKGGKDVTATGLKELDSGDTAVVLVARNSGLKPEDRELLDRVMKFFRESTGKASEEGMYNTAHIQHVQNAKG
jgi:hypothetical protein